MIVQKSSNMLIDTQETFLIIISVKKAVLLHIYVESMMYYHSDVFQKMLLFSKCIKLIKSDIKSIYNVTKDSIPNNCCSFELSIHQIVLKKVLSSKNCF